MNYHITQLWGKALGNQGCSCCALIIQSPTSLFITTKFLLTEKAKANIILYMTLVCNPWIQKKRTTKYCMCSQHTWRNLYTLYIHLFAVFAARVPTLHCSCHPFLQHNVNHVCQRNWAVQILYLSFPHILQSVRIKIVGETSMYGEHFKSCKWTTNIVFSCECLPTCSMLSGKFRQHHTHSQSNWMCISEFYWAAIEASYVETGEQCSVFVQMQCSNNDSAQHKDKDIFHCHCPSGSEECS